MTADSRTVRCGIVLAAGEGERLKPFVRQLRGDALPKQYVNFVGSRSMLEHTFARAERLIAPEHLFTVVGREHLGYAEVRRQLSGRPSGTLVVQPENKETGPGVLLPLTHLYRRHADPIVALFPSDHFVLQEELFMAHVDLACGVVERFPNHLVLLGMEPDGPEPEYGYILPGAQLRQLQPLALRQVACFVEKPSPGSARELISDGGLWNTMVMVFRASTMLRLVWRGAPMLYSSFTRIWNAIGTRSEKDAIDDAYRELEPINFSRHILEPLSRLEDSPLLVLPVRGVSWSDWGSQRRIFETLEKTGLRGRAPKIEESLIPDAACAQSHSATG